MTAVKDSMFFFLRLPLVLSFKEISLRPELSSQPRIRIQGGSPERDGAGGVVEAGQDSFFQILDAHFLYLCVVSA